MPEPTGDLPNWLMELYPPDRRIAVEFFRKLVDESMLLEIAEHTVVRITVETSEDDSERREWLEQGKKTLASTWDNEADDVYNVLLTK